jgi:DNA-binding transcriptional MerR regulator
VRDHTNKRWFDDKARRQLQFIAKMRRAGLTISAIGGILEKADREGGRDYMALAVESLSARLETLERERLEVLTALTAITDDEQARPTPAAPSGLTRRLAAHRQADMAEL